MTLVNDTLNNPTADQLRELSVQGLSVYYRLLNHKPVAVVLDVNDTPLEAIQYNAMVNRLAELNVNSLLYTRGEQNHEHKLLIDWFNALHPPHRDNKQTATPSNVTIVSLKGNIHRVFADMEHAKAFVRNYKGDDRFEFEIEQFKIQNPL